MKKLLTLITLGAIIITMTPPVLARRFKDKEHQDAYFEREREAFQKARDNMGQGKTNSVAISEAIEIIFGLYFIGGTPEGATRYTQNLMEEIGVPKEQQIKTLEYMTRERLSAIEKDEKILTPIRVLELLPMLAAIPDYDMLPILKESAPSKDGRIRATALRITEDIIATLQENNQTNDIAKLTAFLAELRQPEQPPPKED